MTRAARMTTTSTGITIGAAYVARPQPLGTHAQAIQRALLRRPRRSLAPVALLALCAVAVARLRAIPEATPVVLYQRHRSLGFTRRQSLARAVWCWL